MSSSCSPPPPLQAGAPSLPSSIGGGRPGIDAGPLLRGLTRSGQPRPTRLSDASINRIVKNAVARTGSNPAEYSTHGLRAGFVTYANLMGQSDRAIARQTRHRSLASLGPYVRIQDARTNNAAVELRT